MLTVYKTWLQTKVQGFIKDEEGASAVEYGLIVGLIAVMIIAALTLIGGETGLQGLFDKVATAVTGAAADAPDGP